MILYLKKMRPGILKREKGKKETKQAKVYRIQSEPGNAASSIDRGNHTGATYSPDSK